MKTMKLLLMLVFFFIIPGLLACQSLSNVFGKVVDADTNNPIADVDVILNNVYIDGVIVRTTTNKAGEFSFSKLSTGDFEYELEVIYIEERNAINNLNYYEQSYKIKFLLEKGKNLFLKPLKLRKGAKISGITRLFDGTVISNAILNFKIADKNNFDSTRMSWYSESHSSGAGEYISPLLPTDVDIIVRASDLFNQNKNEAYDTVSSTFKISKTDKNKRVDIIIPNIPTEIRGIIVNKVGLPLSNQEITINAFSGIYNIKTDNSGTFQFKYINPRSVSVFISYFENGKYVDSYRIDDLLVNLGESIFLNIILDTDNFFKYNIVRSKL